ncbi:Lrp/AsnC family transcriptional regulator [Aurantiacibacter sediminis]|uniref:Lrp/AsnC family transcriptional regulator n=1 Tax=Aurantiacibacter sediminis TaxID=2793064 RepID=UPI002D80D614|nr:Lrp/AsnC family transcriptional regulator [Aurantiacibacter sediminis]
MDRKLVRSLQKDAALSQQRLAESIGVSPASLWRRLKSLEKTGLLGKLVRLVDPVAAGLSLDVICQVQMQNHDEETRTSFEEFVASRGEILACFSTSGEWDYLLHIIVPDIAGYERLLMEDLLRHPGVSQSSSHFALKRIKHTTVLPIS